MSKNLQIHKAAPARHVRLYRRRSRVLQFVSPFVLPSVAAIVLGLWLGVVSASSAMAAPAAQAAPPAVVARFNNVSIYSGPGTGVVVFCSQQAALYGTTSAAANTIVQFQQVTSGRPGR